MMGLSDNMRTLLLTPEREVKVQVAVERDNGELSTFIGYRMQHDSARGPMERGVTISPRSQRGRSPFAGDTDDLENPPLSISPTAVPRGGVSVNVRELSQAELERITRKFIDELHDMIGPDKDIPAPDMGTKPHKSWPGLQTSTRNTTATIPPVSQGNHWNFTVQKAVKKRPAEVW